MTDILGTMADPEIQKLISEQASAIEGLQSHSVSIDSAWTLMAGFLVVFMHAGFAMLETGSVRESSKSYVLGYGFAFGEDKGQFVGGSTFGGGHEEYKING